MSQLLRHFIAFLVIACATTLAASQQFRESSGNYDIDLSQVHGAMRAVQVIKEICSEDFPQRRPRIEALYAKWRHERLPFLDEMERHMAASIERAAKGNPHIAADNQINLQASFDAFKIIQRQAMSSGGREVYESRCSNFDILILSPQWDLEKSFSTQVASIRKGPR